MQSSYGTFFTSPLAGEVDRSLIGREGGRITSVPPSLSLPRKGGGESERLRRINHQSLRWEA